VGSLKHIALVETINWKWNQFWNKAVPGSKSGLIVGVLLGLIVGLIAGMSAGLRSYGLIYGLSAGLNFGLSIGLPMGLFGGLILGLISGLVSGLVGGFTDTKADKVSPNQGIKLSRKNALAASLFTWLTITLVVGLIGRLTGGLSKGVILSLSGGLTTGLIVGLNRGGSAVIKHYALRLILWRKGYTPFRFIKLLDHCAKLILLKKVGGGYIFIHGMLLDYFAELECSAARGAQAAPEKVRLALARKKARTRLIAAFVSVTVASLIFITHYSNFSLKSALELGKWFAEAKRYLDAKQYAKALPPLQRAADAGNTDAMNRLGWLYMNGWGAPQDYARAREWFQKAAEAGEVVAMYNLGVLYEDGLGVAQDYARAREWFQKAAEAGEVAAMYNLGVLYEDGLGVAQDYAKARQWYQRAANAGSDDARRALSWLPSK
jgi:hypothetical protein